MKTPRPPSKAGAGGGDSAAKREYRPDSASAIALPPDAVTNRTCLGISGLRITAVFPSTSAKSADSVGDPAELRTIICLPCAMDRTDPGGAIPLRLIRREWAGWQDVPQVANVSAQHHAFDIQETSHVGR